MERREFLKFGLGIVAGATALAASANAAPLPPIPPTRGPAPAHGTAAEPALVTQSEVDRLQPEQVHWRHGWHRHWHRRHWGWRRWHHRHWRRHWHRHHWHRHYW